MRIQEDKLETLFNLPRIQVSKMLNQLVVQHMVCATTISESRKRVRLNRAEQQAKAAAEAASAAAAAARAAAGEDDEDDDEDGAASAPNKVTVQVFYLNPRRFVDSVRFRIHMIEDSLRTQERKVTDKPAFQCGTCRRKVLGCFPP